GAAGRALHPRRREPHHPAARRAVARAARAEEEGRAGAERAPEGRDRGGEDATHSAALQPARHPVRDQVLVHGLEQGAARAGRDLPSGGRDAGADAGVAQGVRKDSSLNKTYLDVIDALAGAGDDAGLTFVASDGTSERTLGWRSLHRELTARGRQL